MAITNNNPNQDPGKAETEQFLTLLDPGSNPLYSFQTYDDGREEPKRTALTRVLHATRDQLPVVLPKLQLLNAGGAGVFVTVNETNGRGRKGADIVRVRALHIDLDGAPLEPVLTSERPPHIVTATSPGRYHAYWLVEGMSLEDFRGAQEALLEKFGGDRNVKSIEHVMRVPGFFHRKGAPFLCRIHTVNQRPPYRADEFEKKPQPVYVPSTDSDDEVNLKAVGEAVIFIANPNLPWAEWNRIGMAIFRATGGSEEGFEIFDRWSQRSAKYTARTTRARWQHYFRSPPERIGIATLTWQANRDVPDWRDRLDIALWEHVARRNYGVSFYELLGIATPEEQAAGAPLIKKRAPGLRESEAQDRAAFSDVKEKPAAELPPPQPEQAEPKTEKSDPQPPPLELPPPPRPAPPPHTKLIVPSTTFIANFQPPDYLIDGWLQRRFIYSFTGLTGSGKTAIVLRLTAHVAFGLSLGAREVEQGKVLYLAGENPDDVRMRWIKLCEEMELDATTAAVWWREGTMLLGNSYVWEQLINDCRAAGPFALVVVDTAAAYFDGKDENDNVQAGSYARLLRTFTKEIGGGPTVLVTTHPTKNAPPENLLPRGGGAFLAEMDGNLTCVYREKIAEVHWLGKFRGPDFAPLQFLLTHGTTEKLKDSKGRLIVTVTARPLEQAEHAAREAANARDEDQLLKLLVDQPSYSVADMARAMGWFYATGEPYKTKVARVLAALKADGLAKKEGDRWQATRAGRNKAANITHSTREEVPF